jgi:hypothetical protein
MSEIDVLRRNLSRTEEILGLKKVALSNFIKKNKELKEEIFQLKTKNNLVEVPQFVADWFEYQLKNNNDLNNFDGDTIFRIIQDVIKVRDGQSTWEYHGITDEIAEFAENNEKLFLNLIVNCSFKVGYTVKKESVYRLENQLTGHFLYKTPDGDFNECIEKSFQYYSDRSRFTESEIDVLYEKLGEKLGSYARAMYLSDNRGV